ncbi:hypothetical protein [Rheinheimera sp.]|uniref:hypothetical protein n=1 Tax=Rheinheimera sp. TaxID=1869214 RepID=UPI004047072A
MTAGKHFQMKYGVFSQAVRPSERDDTAVDGGFMFGWRKVRIADGVGFVKAGGVKFGHKDLAAHVGKWVYVDASDYWATTAVIGYGLASESIMMGGIKCGFLSDLINKE